MSHILRYAATILTTVVLSIAPSAALADANRDAIDRVTVPLLIEDGRPVVEVTLRTPSGREETARFLVDTGGGAFILPEPLAKALGLDWGEPFEGDGHEFARPTTAPEAFLDDLQLPLKQDRVLIALGTDSPVNEPAGLLPAHVLAQHHVIFDYPGRTLTLAAPDSIDPVGRAVPMPVSQPMGFPRTEIEVDGKTYGMLLDTGPPATILSQAVFESWTNAHPDWTRHEGAHGDAAALARAGGQVLGTLVVEDLAWAGFTLDAVTMGAQREGVFEDGMSRMMTAPVVGALGSNAFMDYRLELDYADQMLYVSKP